MLKTAELLQQLLTAHMGSVAERNELAYLNHCVWSLLAYLTHAANDTPCDIGLLTSPL